MRLRSMQFTYDIHSHSTHSDGDNSPTVVAEKAKAAGLTALVLTDHNTVSGLDAFSQACARLGLETFEGIEVSARHTDAELHVTGYSLQFDRGQLRAGLRSTIIGYDTRISGMLALLQEREETTISFRTLREQKSDEDPITKYDLVKAIVQERGGNRDHAPALQKLINRGGPCFVPYTDDFLNPVSAVSLIQAAGGVGVLAHPGQYARRHPEGLVAGRAELVRLLPGLIQHGLIGIECRSFEHRDDDVAFFSDLAQKNQLLVLGSSDWHGELHHPTRVFGQLGVTAEEFGALRAHLPR